MAYAPFSGRRSADLSPIEKCIFTCWQENNTSRSVIDAAIADLAALTLQHPPTPTPTVTVPREEWERMHKLMKEMIIVDDMGNGLCWYCGDGLQDGNEDCPFCVSRQYLDSLATPGNAEETQTTQ